MIKEVKKQTLEYRKCSISYVINEEDDKFSASAGIKIPDKPEQDKLHILPNSFDSLETAEEEIIKSAKALIDDVIFVKKITKAE